MRQHGEGPTLRELERYLMERGELYGLSSLERRIRRRDSVGDLVGSYGGEIVPVVVKANIDDDLLYSLEAYSDRTGNTVHLFVLEGSRVEVERPVVIIHVIDEGDLEDWLVGHRSNETGWEMKGSLSDDLRNVISYMERKEYSIVGPEEVIEYLGAEGGQANGSADLDIRRARYIIGRLSRKRWLRKLTHDRYLLLPLRSKETFWSEDPLVVASNIVSPSYVSYGAALSFHNLTEQVMYRMDVATLRRHAPFEFQSVRYNFIVLKSHKFFGFRAEGRGPQPAVVAEAEKAIVDVLDRMPVFSDAADPIGALVYGEGSLDLDRLVEYSIRMRNGALCRRLGYLLERLRHEGVLGEVSSKHLETLGSSIGDYWSYTPLSTAAPDEGLRDERWRVVDNVDVAAEIESRAVR